MRNVTNLNSKFMLPKLTLKFETTEFPKVQVKQAHHVTDLLRGLYDPDTIEATETFILLFLNKANITIGYAELGGSHTAQVALDPKIVLAYAINSLAYSVILSHNHPSGSLQPSNSDKEVTRFVVNLLDAVKVKVLDHIIITKEKHYSFSDEGIFNF